MTRHPVLNFFFLLIIFEILTTLSIIIFIFVTFFVRVELLQYVIIFLLGIGEGYLLHLTFDKHNTVPISRALVSTLSPLLLVTVTLTIYRAINLLTAEMQLRQAITGMSYSLLGTAPNAFLSILLFYIAYNSFTLYTIATTKNRMLLWVYVASFVVIYGAIYVLIHISTTTAFTTIIANALP